LQRRLRRRRRQQQQRRRQQQQRHALCQQMHGRHLLRQPLFLQRKPQCARSRVSPPRWPIHCLRARQPSSRCRAQQRPPHWNSSSSSTSSNSSSSNNNNSNICNYNYCGNTNYSYNYNKWLCQEGPIEANS
jgi:hypothetical protein